MKKVFLLLATLFLSIGLIGINNVSAIAESNETIINDYNGLKNFLEAGDTSEGKLADNITVTDQIHVKGTKTLDLNGNTIKGAFDIIIGPKDPNYKEHILCIDKGASLTINDSSFLLTGTLDGDNRTGGILNKGTLVINQANIINGNAHSGAGVFNSGTFTMNDGLIKKCHDLQTGPYANDGYGAGVYNDNGELFETAPGTFYFNGGEVTECQSLYGGGIYISYPGIFIMGGEGKTAKITNCVATFSGGALNGVGDITLKTGTEITGNYSENCAIVSSINFVIDGEVKIKNINPNNGLRKDILVSNNYFELPYKQKLTITDNASLIDGPIYVDMISKGYAKESLPYIFSANRSVKYMFNTVSADEYFEEGTDNTLSIRRIKVEDQPTISNKYTVGIGDHDIESSGIDVSYQWYLADNYSKIQIGDAGNYKTDYIDVNVSAPFSDTKYIGNFTWEGSSIYLQFKGLKKDQLLSFNYSIPTGSKELEIRLENQSGTSVDKYIDNDESTFSVLIPSDGDYDLHIWYNNADPTKKAQISNIYIKEVDYGKAIIGENEKTIKHPLSNTNVYCEITLNNKNNGRSTIIRSNVVEFEAIYGDTAFYKDSKLPLTLKVPATDEEYEYFLKNGEVYLDGNKLNSSQYVVSKGSIIVKINASVLKNFEDNSKHTIYLNNISKNAGKQIATTTFTVKPGKRPTKKPIPIPGEGDMPYDATSQRFYTGFTKGRSTDSIAHFKYESEYEEIKVTNLAGEILTEGEDYTIKQVNDDLKIILNKTYLDTLKEGPNNIKLTIDGYDFDVIINVTEVPKPIPSPGEGDMPYDIVSESFYTSYTVQKANDSIAHFKYDDKAKTIKVENNDETLTPLKESDYIVKQENNDLRIIIKKDYLDTLNEGPHYLKLTIDGYEFDVTLYVEAKAKPIPTTEEGEMTYYDSYKVFYTEFYKSESNNSIAHFKYDDQAKTIKVENNDETLTPLKESDYIVKQENNDLRIIIKKDYLDTLNEGPHYLKLTIDGYEFDVALYVDVKPEPKPTPKKDESCEKVIGPTWHWNNKKGICEDTGVVKTYTK